MYCIKNMTFANKSILSNPMLTNYKGNPIKTFQAYLKLNGKIHINIIYSTPLYFLPIWNPGFFFIVKNKISELIYNLKQCKHYISATETPDYKITYRLRAPIAIIEVCILEILSILEIRDTPLPCSDTYRYTKHTVRLKLVDSLNS